jgi:hypothetical protein
VARLRRAWGRLPLPDDGNVKPPFNRERAVGGLFLIGLVGILALVDAFRPDYQLESFPLFLILGTGALLLGVEGIRRVVG